MRADDQQYLLRPKLPSQSAGSWLPVYSPIAARWLHLPADIGADLLEQVLPAANGNRTASTWKNYSRRMRLKHDPHLIWQKLFVTDEELIVLLGVPLDLGYQAITMWEAASNSFPRKREKFKGRRYLPAVLAYLDRTEGLELGNGAARSAAESRGDRTRLPRRLSPAVASSGEATR